MWEEANWWDGVGPLLLTVLLLGFGFWAGYKHGFKEGYDEGYRKGKHDVLEAQRKEAVQARQRRRVLRLLQRHKAELRQGKIATSGIDAKSVLEIIEGAEKAITTKARSSVDDWETLWKTHGQEVAMIFLPSAFEGYYYFHPDELLKEYTEYCRANNLPAEWVRKCEECLVHLGKAQEDASADGEAVTEG